MRSGSIIIEKADALRLIYRILQEMYFDSKINAGLMPPLSNNLLFTFNLSTRNP
jgi:hypothetical protein